jgi:hypothetical protein
MKISDIESTGPVNLKRLRKLAGVTQGSGADSPEHSESPLTHGAADVSKELSKHNVEPGTEQWMKTWMTRPKLSGDGSSNILAQDQ